MAWLLVFLTCAVSSFIILGLTYGLESQQHGCLHCSVAFSLSVFLVQPSKSYLCQATEQVHPSIQRTFHGSATITSLRSSCKTSGRTQKKWTDATSLSWSSKLKDVPAFTQDEIMIFKKKEEGQAPKSFPVPYLHPHSLHLSGSLAEPSRVVLGAH